MLKNIYRFFTSKKMENRLKIDKKHVISTRISMGYISEENDKKSLVFVFAPEEDEFYIFRIITVTSLEVVRQPNGFKAKIPVNSHEFYGAGYNFGLPTKFDSVGFPVIFDKKMTSDILTDMDNSYTVTKTAKDSNGTLKNYKLNCPKNWLRAIRFTNNPLGLSNLEFQEIMDNIKRFF